MRFETIRNAEHPLYKRAEQLYKLSFPLHEQREAASQEVILQDPAYHFSLVYEDAAYVGLVLYWETERFIYVEHLCILPEMRNKQYGQKTLALLAESQKTVILEIDPPVDEISMRRKGFYERCGFVVNPFSHVHPPYHKGNHGHDLVIMSYPKQLAPEEYKRFRDYLNTHVMRDVF